MPNQEIKNFIDKLGTGDNAGAGDAFKDALRGKVGDALDQRRQDIAGKMFAEPHSDKKPEVATPGQFNRDGTITNADGTDGKTAADLSAETKPEIAEPFAEPVPAAPETPAVDTPAVDTPAVDTPAVEAPAEAPTET
jgi:hypothetical protein